MADLERAIRNFVDGSASVQTLQDAAEGTPGELANQTIALVTEYRNTGMDENELRLRVELLVAGGQSRLVAHIAPRAANLEGRDPAARRAVQLAGVLLHSALCTFLAAW